MRNVLHSTRLLKDAEALTAYVLTGDTKTEERRYVAAVAADVVRIGRKGDWELLAAAIVRVAASGTHLWNDTRAQARILSRALPSR